MEVEIETLPRIKIVLDNDEAIWLMGFIQNYPGNPEHESESEQAMRHALFTELMGYLK